MPVRGGRGRKMDGKKMAKRRVRIFLPPFSCLEFPVQHRRQVIPCVAEMTGTWRTGKSGSDARAAKIWSAATVGQAEPWHEVRAQNISRREPERRRQVACEKRRESATLQIGAVAALAHLVCPCSILRLCVVSTV